MVFFIGPYDIPKGTAMIENLYLISRDPKSFKDPEEFIFDRFIGPDGKFKAHPKVVPFGIGQRDCLGQSLAQAQLFIFTVTLIQHFKFASSGEGQTLKAHHGFMRVPQLDDVKFYLRKDA